MDTKAAFKKWAIDNGFSIQFDTDNNEYSHASTRNAFRGFLGGREAIEIELPELVAGDYGHKYLFVARDVVEAITSHGIRIKGKAE
jgi:hypothetical protein